MKAKWEVGEEEEESGEAMLPPRFGGSAPSFLRLLATAAAAPPDISTVISQKALNCPSSFLAGHVFVLAPTDRPTEIPLLPQK